MGRAGGGRGRRRRRRPERRVPPPASRRPPGGSAAPCGSLCVKAHSIGAEAALPGPAARRRGAVGVQPVALGDEQVGGGRAQQPDDLREHRLGHRLGRGLRHQLGAQAVERRGLVLAGHGAGLAFSHAAGLDADDDADDEKGHQRDPVLGVADVERVVGRQEEEVPGQEGQHGGHHRRPGAGRACHQQDDEQVEDRPLALGEVGTTGQEDRGRDRDRQGGEHVTVPGEARRDGSEHEVTHLVVAGSVSIVAACGGAAAAACSAPAAAAVPAPAALAEARLRLWPHGLTIAGS